MRYDVTLPWWAWVLMGLGLAAFAAMVVVSVRRNRGVKRSLFAAPYTLWMIIFTIVPLIIIVYYALTDASGSFTLNNLRDFWDSNYSRRAGATSPAIQARLAARGMSNMEPLLYSLWMAFLCTVICLVLAYPTALFMADRRMKRASSLVILFVVPMWMNVTLRTYAMRILMVDDGPLINFLRLIGFADAQLMDTPTAVLIGMVYNFLPFMIFPIYTVLSKLDPALLEASSDLGASPGRSLIKVTMPLSIPGVVSGITMVFMPAVTTFTLNVMLGGSKRLMLGNLIEQTFTKQNNWNMGSAMSLVMMVLILISLTILRKADPNNEGGGL